MSNDDAPKPPRLFGVTCARCGEAPPGAGGILCQECRQAIQAASLYPRTEVTE